MARVKACAFCHTTTSRKDWDLLAMLATRCSPLSTFSGKLPEKPQVVLVKVANVIDAVEQHRQTLESHAECVAAPLVRVITDAGKNRRINQPAAANLDP